MRGIPINVHRRNRIHGGAAGRSGHGRSCQARSLSRATFAPGHACTDGDPVPSLRHAAGSSHTGQGRAEFKTRERAEPCDSLLGIGKERPWLRGILCSHPDSRGIPTGSPNAQPYHAGPLCPAGAVDRGGSGLQCRPPHPAARATSRRAGRGCDRPTAQAARCRRFADLGLRRLRLVLLSHPSPDRVPDVIAFP